MVKITKNGKTLEVTKGVFKNTFKDQGWVIANGDSDKNRVEGEEPSIPVNTEPETQDEIPDENVEEEENDSSDEDWDDIEDEFEDDEAEKPLSDMSKKELVAKAESLGIDLSGQKYTTNQIRDMIREKI